MSSDATTFAPAAPCERAALFLLFSEARVNSAEGIWRFVLAQVGTSTSLTAMDHEPVACRERLELLAVVRGLEAIDQPARVTLVTGSRYVSRGLKRGLAEWRVNDFQWERFGQQVPVRDQDLWRRVDRALEFHQVDCRLWHLDSHVDTAQSASPRAAESTGRKLAAAAKDRWRRAAKAAASWGEALQGTGLAAG
jgi:ribonuclease HI